ncbi:putative MFS peptide transporter [Lineolata rhizophorae]|uniref:Putative MFS peptide transporter n=1 Tax=Lineolata rhizophorae TaxID=578093 RepID=A0A6A6P012_9PEZI|nr:putative MFS peptide transporter [Lineolata rhizophorae]
MARGAYTLVNQSEAEPEDVASNLLDEPSSVEKRLLRRVPDNLPWSAFLIAVVELCERFAYYGLSGPFQNYIANERHDKNGLPGAIGLRQANATAYTSFFQFWCYVTPIIGALIADQYWGRLKTIVIFSLVYMSGILILFITSLPAAIEQGLAFSGLLLAMAVIGLGTGGIKSNVSPLIAEQYQNTMPFVRTLRSGERVIIDPSATIQRIYMIFYLCINLGSLSSLATTTLELRIDFWAAYLLPLVIFVVGFLILLAGRASYVLRPPKGSVIIHCFQAISFGVRHRDLDAAKPSNSRIIVPWDDNFVEELKRALMACKIFLFFPIYWLVFMQMVNNLVSQAGQMERHGIPNDIMQTIDAFSIVVFIPIVDRWVYPAIRRCGFALLPITRIFFGFIFASLSMFYAALLQSRIYASGPCFEAPSTCAAALRPDGSYQPNNVHIAAQAPAYLFIGISEIFAAVTGLEYAYTKAPPSMRSFIMSLFLLTSAGGAFLAAIVSPVAKDPHLVSMYAGLAFACFAAGAMFWLLFRKYNKVDGQLDLHARDADDNVEMDPLRGESSTA